MTNIYIYIKKNRLGPLRGGQGRLIEGSDWVIFWDFEKWPLSRGRPIIERGPLF